MTASLSTGDSSLHVLGLPPLNSGSREKPPRNTLPAFSTAPERLRQGHDFNLSRILPLGSVESFLASSCSLEVLGRDPIAHAQINGLA